MSSANFFDDDGKPSNVTSLRRVTERPMPDTPDDPGYLASVEQDTERGEPAIEPPPAAANDDPNPLVATPARLPDATRIPPRQWLYGTSILRGFITVLVAPGGLGKTSYELGRTLSLATGRKLLGEHVHKRVRCWAFNLEDPLEEIERRVAAMCIRHNIGNAELDGWLFINSGRDRSLCFAKTLEDGRTVVFPDKVAIIEEIKRHAIGYLNVDPFVASHSLDENRNTEIDAALRAWRDVANETNCAIGLTHHTRKGATGSIEDSRGAVALLGAARVAQALVTMQASEAERWNIRPDAAWQYIRVAPAGEKVNLTPRGSTARWFRLESVPLGNCTEDYPKGDNVQAVVAWSPPSPWEGLGMDLCVEILETIERGPAPGELYTRNAQGRGNVRWVGKPVMEIADKSRDEAKNIIGLWWDNELLVAGDWTDASRHTQTGVTVNRAKLDEMRGQIAPAPDAEM